MLLEIAATYGAMRAIADVIGWIGRDRTAQQARQQNLVPVQNSPGLYRNADTGRFQRMEPCAGSAMEGVYGGPHEVTDFEITIRGQTRNYR